MGRRQIGVLAVYLALWSALLCGAWAAGAGTFKSVFEMGASQRTVLDILGKPTNYVPADDTGKEIWYYNSATVTFLNGKVTGWRKFVEQLPLRAADAPPLRLWSNKSEVLAALGFPPTALHYQPGTRLIKRPCGDEEWQYSVGTLVFQGELVCGWRNLKELKTPIVTLGVSKLGTPMIAVGATRRQVVDYAGTPPTLICYTDNGDELWNYPDGQVFLRAGKLIWMGPYPQPAETKPDGTNPAQDQTQTQPPAAVDPPKEEDKGFVGEQDFIAFRVAYQQVLQQMVKVNPRITLTTYYQAMLDCINGVPWGSIKGQMETDQAYAQGVQAIYNAYQEYLKQKKAQK